MFKNHNPNRKTWREKKKTSDRLKEDTTIGRVIGVKPLTCLVASESKASTNSKHMVDSGVLI
jgi:LysM repeat protein